MKSIVFRTALLFLFAAGAFPTHAVTNQDGSAAKKGAKRTARKKKQKAEPAQMTQQTMDQRYANLDLRDVADMSFKDYLQFASDLNNLKAVQESVRETVRIMHDAMKEKHLPQDQIGMIEDIPEVDEILEKNGKPNWLTLPAKLQKRQIGVTDSNIKNMHSNLLGGVLPARAYAEYQGLLAEKKIPFRIIPLLK